jgi:concentrative nucleoside transporter, CNT family
MGLENLISVGGLVVLLGVAWLFSAHRWVINVRLLGWGVGLQLLFGFFVFVFPPGRNLFFWLNKLVFRVLSFAGEGSRFVFGSLALGPEKKGSLGFFFAFQVLPAVIFFSALVALLYHFRVMQLMIRAFSWLFTRLLRVSGAESLCASSNIFVGVESALTIRPYLHQMTRSELCTILTAGMATIASTVLGLYALMLKGSFPSIAGHLISASILTAPAALVMSKLVMPETETPQTLGKVVEPEYEQTGNWVEAIVHSTMAGVKLAVGIASMLIAFLGLLAMLNAFLGWCGGWVGLEGLSLQQILGYLFYPLVVAAGVPLEDAGQVSSLLGLRVVATELPVYQKLASLAAQGEFHSPRSVVIATYFFCGFAHVPSVAVFVGGMSAVEPRRARDLSALGFRALLAATLACMMTGAVAGLFYTGKDTVLLGNQKQKTISTSAPVRDSYRTVLPATRPSLVPASRPALRRP